MTSRIDVAITSFTISAVNKYTTTTASDGTQTVSKTTLTSKLPVFNIDQYNHKIFNNEPLVAGCDLKHILVTLTTKRNGQVGIKSLTSDSVLTYVYTDSIDFSQQREFRVYALNGSGYRAYQVTVNKESSEVIEKQWERVANEESAPKALYQDYALFPLLNVTENICYPMELQKLPQTEQKRRSEALAAQVGLGPELLARYPGAISGGEQQRVAIARALATGAKVILADEPTGNLDQANSDQIVELLLRAAHEEGRCVIVVTHDPDVAAQADRVLRLVDGILTD